MPSIADRLATALAGRYRVERELGAGGMATVYLAQDVRHDREVAIKVLHPELAAALGGERFLTEIKTTARLQHPHILPLLDSGEADGLLFYVMPYVAGPSLRTRLDREKQLPIADAIRIAREVADALRYAHEHGIVHRDIKPENILLQGDHALVADFGIALAVQQAGGQRMTQTGLSLGTPQYMSPEQAMGEKLVDARADLYALGAVTYEMLAGEPPFRGPTVQAIVAKVLTEDPVPLTTLRRSVPPHVDDAVRAALAKLPADRVSSAQAFADGLAGTIALAPSRATGARPIPESAGRLAPIRQPLLWVLAAITGASLGLAAWQWQLAHRASPQPTVRFMLDVPRDLRVMALGLVGPSVAITPDGKYIVFVAASAEGTRRLFVRSLDALAPRALAGTDGASQPFISPDGRWVGFWAAGRLMKVALDGGAPQTIVRTPEVTGATWMRRGDIMFSHNGRMFTVPANGGEPRAFSVPDSSSGELLQQFPFALEDGEHVLYTSYGQAGLESTSIALISLSSGRVTRLGVRGFTSFGVAGGQLVYNTLNNEILAVPIDLRGARVTGTPASVASGVMIGARGPGKAAMSFNGTLVYFALAHESQMVLATLSGATSALLPDVRYYAYPRYSPDGNRIAMTILSGTTSDVWLYDIASGTSVKLTSSGSVNERPEWTPDGKRVMYRTDRTLHSSMWWQLADLSGAPAPLLAGRKAGGYYEAVMTPDGKAIVYQVDTIGPDVEYHFLQGDTTGKVIAASRFTEYMARVSPNGKWTAFVTDESGATEVVVQPFPGPGPRVQVSTHGGTEPVWSRDGQRLFYRGGRKFIAATVRTSPDFAVTSRTELFDDDFFPALSPHANYDVSPDGRKLLLLKGVNEQRIVVVHNWASELRERLRRTAEQR